MALVIEIMEKEDASAFKLYDLTAWAGGFVHTNVTAVSLEVEYDGTTYTYTSAAGLLTDLALSASHLNLCGTALNSYFEVTPDKLVSGAGATLHDDYFPDGYYEITLYVTYTGEGDLEDYSRQGFLAELYLMASKLPLEIDMDDFDYEENRLQFLCIAMLRSATWAAELGRKTEFETLVEKTNDFLDARSINEVWSS